MPRAIHLYRPQRTPIDDLEAVFVGREHLIQEILDRLHQWEPGSSRQHYLIIGPRGIGKTNLLRLLEHRIRKSPQLHKKWSPISFPEESYGITRITDLLIEALRIISDENNDPNLKKVYDQVKYDDNEERVTDLSLDAFRQFHASKGCGIVLMVENLHRLLERQIRYRPEIHLFRKILIEEDWIVAIGTSPTYLNAVRKPEEPLFEFFQIQLLSELTPGEQQEMLHKLAALERNVTFERDLRGKFRARLQALYHFTGGNPRLIIMLYDLIANKHIQKVKTELDFLLDEITPFYQDRMKDIPEQEGKLLEIMALLPEGCTPTELAKEARMPSKVVRAYMTRLERSGYVRRGQRRQKQTVYIIPERFFRIWHQMNHSRAARKRVQYLLEFFNVWYATKEERNQVWNELTAKFQVGIQEGDEDQIEDLAEYMEYVVAVSKGSERFGRQFDLLKQTVDVSGIDATREELLKLDQEHKTDGDYFVYKGYFLSNELKLHEDALESFRKAIEIKHDDIIALFNSAVALDRLGREYEARQYYTNIASLLSRQRGHMAVIEAHGVLLQILREESDSTIVRISGIVLARTVKDDISNEIIEILRNSDLSWRRQHCATALGLLGSQQAVPALTECLSDEANNVRGSAATALGRIGSELAVDPLIDCLKDEDRINLGSAATALGLIGSERAVDPLIDCLKDEDNYVRGSAANALGRIGSQLAVESLIGSLKDEDRNVRFVAVTALGRIASDFSIPNLSQVMDALMKEAIEDPREHLESAVQMLLKSVFRSSNVKMIQDTLEIVNSHLDNAEELCAPYMATLRYLQSDRDPAIMERQHPEMREAVQLLVEVFDEGFSKISYTR